MFRTPLIVRRVRGVSMAPTLADGDYVVAVRLRSRQKSSLRVGDVVVIEANEDEARSSAIWRSLSTTSMIKRVAGGDAEQGYTVAGDNPTSLSSSSFGQITAADMNARVFLRIPKIGSISRIRRCSGPDLA